VNTVLAVANGLLWSYLAYRLGRQDGLDKARGEADMRYQGSLPLTFFCRECREKSLDYLRARGPR
jgi:hypothetical protein